MRVLSRVLARLEHTATFNTPRSIDNTYTDEIRQLVERYGMEFGEGMQAKVLIPPGRNYVYRLWHNDPGYDRWLAYCVQHKSSPFVPKILSRVRTLNLKFKRMPATEFKLVKLEKLTPLKDHDLEILVDEMFTAMPDNVIDSTLTTMPQYKPFVEFIRGLRGTMRFNDINGDNVMMRGSTPVLTDPLKD